MIINPTYRLWILPVVAILAAGSGIARAETGPGLHIDNWMKHPDIVEVRKIYVEITKEAESGKYKSEERKFDVESVECSTYPVKSETLLRDPEGRVRMYGIVQLGPHREPFLIRRYYDINGILRFVFVDRYISNIRIYLGRTGKVFWAVEKNNGEFVRAQYDHEDWETKPAIAKDAQTAFYARQLCPEITS